MRLAFLSAALALSFVCRGANPPATNIVFVLCDDLTSQAISAYRHPLKLLRTPSIDRLAAEGVLFDRCLVTNSICGPSRATLLTGKYSHKNGIYHNSRPFNGAQVTFPKLLQAARYQTSMFGKWHFSNAPTGFDHWHMFPGQGVYYNPPMIRNGTRVTHEGYSTDLITDFALEWLRGRDRTRPFFLLLSHKAPHREWSPALRHLDWNRGERFPEPDTLFDDFAGRGRAEREQEMMLAADYNVRDSKETAPLSLNPEQRKTWDAYYVPRIEAMRRDALTGRDLVRWKYQRYLHDYLGTVKAIDENLGRLLDYLDQEGLTEKTLVVFASDQGFFLGEHGWFDKRWIYEESVTTPLILRWPGVAAAGLRHRAMVSVLDLAETALDAAGQPVPAEMQGRSLRPLLNGTAPADWRTSFYYHYYEFPGPHSVRKHYGVVTDRYKLFHCYEPEMNYWTLIDRQEDPRELRNVYGDAAHAAARRELHAELDRLRTVLEVPAVDPPESIPPPQRPPAPTKAPAPPTR